MEIVAGTIILIGAFFFLAGTVGLLRFPDTLSRIHALTKADNVGLGCIVLGAILLGTDLLGGIKLIAVWLILTSGNLDQWPLALIVVLAATAASVGLWPERAWRFNFVGVFRFAIFFLAQSTLGGWDVARRALTPSMPLNPGLVEHRFKLGLEEARVLFAWTVSLLPGTASARMGDHELTVHARDRMDHVEEKLRRLETYVAGIFRDT